MWTQVIPMVCVGEYYANGLDLCLVFSITPDDVVLLRFIVFLLRFTVVFSRPQQDREAVWTITSIRQSQDMRSRQFALWNAYY